MNIFSVESIRSTLVLAVLAGLAGCAPMTAQGDTQGNGNQEAEAAATLCLLPEQAYAEQAGEQRTESAVMIQAELAVDDAQRSRGLMHREHLPEDAGMLFYYPSAEYRGFWMFQTLLPLDIAFLDDDGRILQIQTMEPCMSTTPRNCPGYQSDSAARAALELNAGAFDEFSIEVGDYVLDASCQASPWAEGW